VANPSKPADNQLGSHVATGVLTKRDDGDKVGDEDGSIGDRVVSTCFDEM